MTALPSRFAAMLRRIGIRRPGAFTWAPGRSLRVQFSVGVLMVLVPSFAISYALIDRLVVQGIARLASDRLSVEADLISYGLRAWGENNRLMMKSLSYQDVLRSRDVAGSADLLRSLHTLYPDRVWRYWSADPTPRLLATSGETLTAQQRKQLEAAIGRRDDFQAALQGRSGYGVVKSAGTDQGCLLISQPIFRDRIPSLAREQPLFSQHHQATAPLPPGPMGERPTGVLVNCILLETLGRDSGLQQVLSKPSLANVQGLGGDINRNQPIRSALLLLSGHGHVLSPLTEGSRQRIATIQDYERGYWAPLFRVVAEAKQREASEFRRLEVGGQQYFVLVNKVDPVWSSLLIMNEDQFLSGLHHLLRRLVVYGLICLLLASLAIDWQCRRIIAPVRVVGRALQRIGGGDFAVNLVHGRRDEIGELLDNVNRTAERIKTFVSRETSHAVTQKQLETARVIQKDFLVSEMPVAANLDIAPIFLPAYEIGADWYDAMTVDGLVYVVVADVCDKGVPSALYMSVFRSLLRFGLLDYQGEGASDPGHRIRQVVTRVNDYIAVNQGDSMMFATLFVAAVDPQNGDCHYISAGHEMPIVCGSGGLRSLEPTGPALGLFPGAVFEARRLELEPGAYLVAYSDGLTDARSPTDASWGREALERFMQARMGGDASAAAVRDALVSEVQAHMAGTDPFDDLTVMVLHRLA